MEGLKGFLKLRGIKPRDNAALIAREWFPPTTPVHWLMEQLLFELEENERLRQTIIEMVGAETREERVELRRKVM